MCACDERVSIDCGIRMESGQKKIVVIGVATVKQAFNTFSVTNIKTTKRDIVR